VALLGKMGIAPAGVLPLGDMEVVGPSGRRVLLPAAPGHTYPGYAWALPRRALDDELYRAALDAGAEPVFEALRATRKQLATAQGVPAYVIFHDSTLMALATKRPRSRAELEAIPGMGRSKIDRYGDDVLAALAQAQG
jgi:superfamily II DNA helicase RecQ